MAFWFRRRLRIFSGISLNLGKTGISVSLGKGTYVTPRPEGAGTTVGLAETGGSWTNDQSYQRPKVAPLPIAPGVRQKMNEAIAAIPGFVAIVDEAIKDLLKIPALSAADSDELRTCRDLLGQQASKIAGAIYDDAEQLSADADQLTAIFGRVGVISKGMEALQVQKRAPKSGHM